MKKEYCVYVHTNKTNGKKYVGITSRSPEARWKQGYRFNEHFSRAIEKYGWDGFDHDVIMAGITKEQACAWERALIAQFGTQNGHKGYNIQSGGDGCADQNNVPVSQYSLDGKFIKTWESIKDASESFGAARNDGGTQIGMACSGRCKTAHGYLWRYGDGGASIEPYKNNHLKRVVQCTVAGEPVKTWERIIDASRELGIDAGTITKVCKDKYRNCKTAGGYKWRYADEIQGI